MKRIVPVMAVMLLSIFPNAPVFAESETISMHVKLSEQEENVKYQLYADETCTKPLLDENNQIWTLQSDETGEIECEVPSDAFFKQAGSISGYYDDETIYPIQEEVEITLQPIIYTFSLDENLHYQLLKDTEVIAEWNNVEGEKQIQLEAEKQYTFQCLNPPEYHQIKDIEFTVPRFKPAEDPHIQMEQTLYGMVQIETINTDNVSIPDAKYELYFDEACTKQAMDIDGSQSFQATKEDFVLSLKEGTYYLKQVDVPTQYYLSVPQQIEVQEEKTIQINIVNQQVFADISLSDDEGNTIEGELLLGDGEKQWTLTQFDTPQMLERNHMYTLQETRHPSGYYGHHQIQFQTETYTSQIQQINLKLNRFYYPIQFHNSYDNAAIIGAKMAIFDESGNCIEKFTTNQDAYLPSSLKSGMTYTIRTTEVPDGYLSAKEFQFQIPSTSDINTSNQITLFSQPYTHLFLRTKDAETDITLPDTALTLYTDSTGTEIVKDIHGNPVEKVSQADVLFGTYYAKITQPDSHYYEEDAYLPIQVDHTNGVKQTITQDYSPIHVLLQMTSTTNRNPVFGEAEVISQSGQSLGTINFEREQDLYHTTIFEQMTIGETYFIRINSVNGLYTYSHVPKKITLTKQKPTEIPAARFEMNPYMNLKIIGHETELPVMDCGFTVYEDEQCHTIAKDIFSHAASGAVNENGQLNLQLRQGTYWLKVTDPNPVYYQNEEVRKIVIDESSYAYQMKFDFYRPSLHILMKDEHGTMVTDGYYQLLDEKGDVKCEWENTNQTIKENWLLPGHTYRIHEVSAPKGCVKQETDLVFTVPKTGNQDPIILEMKHALKKTIRQVKAAVDEPEVPFQFPWLWLCGSGLFAVGMIVMKNLSNK